MGGVKLETPLESLRGIGPAFLKRLNRLGIKSVRDLLWYFPARYEDFSQIYKIAELEPGLQATVRGQIARIKMRRTWRRHMALVEAKIQDETGSIKAVWFNQPYILNILRAGRFANFSGKVAISDDGDIYLSHPAYEVIGRLPENKNHTKHTARLVPIYHETRGLTSRGLRFLIQPLLANIEPLQEWLPEDVLEKQSLPEINKAVADIHFPSKIDEALAAKKRFAFEDLFLLQLTNLQQKLKLAREKAPVVTTDIEHLKKVISELPYKLTLSQKKSLWEIIQDLARARPMNRLLQGDVGSGKTVIAALAALIASENGYQTAFMAPTEVLARQHFETIKKLFAGIASIKQPPVGLLTSSEARILRETDEESKINPLNAPGVGGELVESIKKSELHKKIKNGDVKIVIGTHALIQKGVKFGNLALVIIDEQHRFGVKQRAAVSGAESGKIPHFLSMSATPIPRTLMLTIFGDLDISLITELPAGRKNIITKIVPPNERRKTYEFIRAEVESGRQVFVICPRIEAPKEQAKNATTIMPQLWYNRSSNFSEFKKLEIKSVKEEYEKLSKKIFPDLKVAMLHGQLKPKEKEKIMREFGDGKTDILVSTSVVEVGVDVPNATIMMIEGADRFGLAQIYQFRGRVGRGPDQSYCFLFTDSPAKTTRERLQAIIEAKNGFELAERDLKIRGPGEFLGTAQTGFPDTAMSGLMNLELVKASREAAAEIMQKSGGLISYPLLKKRLDLFQRQIHLE
jgi:ATP-dependent DNA helicase RecG